MAKIPKAVQQQQIATIPTAPAITDLAGFTKTTRAIGELGKVFGQVGEQFQKARDFRQSTEAKVKYNQQVGDILLAADQDTNPDNVDTYLEQLESIRLTAAEGVQSDTERFKVQAEADIFIDSKRISVNRGFIEKQLDANKAALVGYIDELQDSFIKTTNKSERKTIEALRDQQIQEAVEIGVLDREAAENWKNKLDESWKELNFQRDLYPDPDTGKQPNLAKVAKKLSVNFYGFNQEQRIKAGKDFEQAIKREEIKQESALKALQSKEESILLGKVMDGSAGPGEVLKKLNAEFISPRAAENMLATIIKGKAFDKDIKLSEIYKDVAKAALSEADFQNINNIILESVAKEGGINIIQATSLINMSKQLEAGSTKIGFLQRIVSGWIKAWEVQSPSIIVGSMALNLIRKVWPGDGKEVSNEQADEIAKDIQRDMIIQQHPQLSGHEEIPNAIFEQGKGFNVTSNQVPEGMVEFNFNTATGRIERR